MVVNLSVCLVSMRPQESNLFYVHLEMTAEHRLVCTAVHSVLGSWPEPQLVAKSRLTHFYQ